MQHSSMIFSSSLEYSPVLHLSVNSLQNFGISSYDVSKEKNLLKKDGIIVTKIDSIEEIYKGYKEIKLLKSKKYGNTTVCIYYNEE